MTTENKLNNRLLLKRQYIQMIEYKYKQLLYARPPKIFKNKYQKWYQEQQKLEKVLLELYQGLESLLTEEN